MALLSFYPILNLPMCLETWFVARTSFQHRNVNISSSNNGCCSRTSSVCSSIFYSSASHRSNTFYTLSPIPIWHFLGLFKNYVCKLENIVIASVNIRVSISWWDEVSPSKYKVCLHVYCTEVWTIIYIYEYVHDIVPFFVWIQYCKIIQLSC